MAGITDRPYRQLCRELGAGLAVSEMVASNSSLWASRKSLKRLDFSGESGPISVQIVGADPATMADAAKINADRGAQIIDINMGCPAKKVCRVAAGSALMRDEGLVARILETVVDAVDVPVTLKIRTGWEPSQRNGVSIARIAEQSGIAAIAVHGRTRACRFSGQAEYDTIRRIKASVSIPVIANGDINSPQKAAQVLAQTGADALMIGRAARGRPWIFQEIAHYLGNDELLPEPSPQWQGGVFKRHLQSLYSFYGEQQGVRIARKHIAWYTRGHAQSAALRKQINTTDSADDQMKLGERFFVRLGNTRERAA